MTAQNLEKKFVTKLAKPMSVAGPFSRRLYSAGVTLVEMMVAVAVGGVLSLTVATLYAFSVGQFQLIVSKNQAQEGLMVMAYQLRNILGQAQDLSVVPGPISNISYDLSVSPGQILASFDSTTINSATCPGGPNCLRVLAYFLRESGTGNQAGVAGSNVVPSAVFFQAPTVKSPGRLYIDVGSGTVPGGPGIGPRLDNIWFDNVVAVKIQTVSVGSNAKSSTFTLTVRYFLDPERANWVWCPSGAAAPFLPLCPSPTGRYAAYKDAQMVVEVGFRNNVLNAVSVTGGNNPDRLFGGMFFFKSIAPMW